MISHPSRRSFLSSYSFLRFPLRSLISIFGPRARIRVGIGCRFHGLGPWRCGWLTVGWISALSISFSVHGRLTRVVSSMNSTRTWVTPPREPVRPRTPRDVRYRAIWGGVSAEVRTGYFDDYVVERLVQRMRVSGRASLTLDGLLGCVWTLSAVV